jgi:hypothetical protein
VMHHLLTQYDEGDDMEFKINCLKQMMQQHDKIW